VKKQYSGGIYKISSWAHLINAHPLPGEGIIKGLKECDSEEGGSMMCKGLLLIAEMSSQGSLFTPEYSTRAIDMAVNNMDFVVGFIAGRRLECRQDFIYFTPGIQFSNTSDSLGQKYKTPDDAIRGGSDVIIVGRGIIDSKDQIMTAKDYRRKAWESYEKRISNKE
jgi:orotidine 5'-phosphate decarboxylase subfamily 1